jgi:hypothetical protein
MGTFLIGFGVGMLLAVCVGVFVMFVIAGGKAEDREASHRAEVSALRGRITGMDLALRDVQRHLGAAALTSDHHAWQQIDLALQTTDRGLREAVPGPRVNQPAATRA